MRNKAKIIISFKLLFFITTSFASAENEVCAEKVSKTREKYTFVEVTENNGSVKHYVIKYRVYLQMNKNMVNAGLGDAALRLATKITPGVRTRGDKDSCHVSYTTRTTRELGIQTEHNTPPVSWTGVETVLVTNSHPDLKIEEEKNCKKINTRVCLLWKYAYKRAFQYGNAEIFKHQKNDSLESVISFVRANNPDLKCAVVRGKHGRVEEAFCEGEDN